MVIVSNEENVLVLQNGKDGTPADSKYIWVKYSQYSDGRDMTDDPTDAIFMGISYNQIDINESENPEDYTWIRIQGKDGENGYTIILENENVTFQVDKNNVPTVDQSTTCDITVFKGVDIVNDFTVGEITAPEGIYTTISGNTVTISVFELQAIEQDYGNIHIPIVVGEMSIIKSISFNLLKVAVGITDTNIMYYSSTSNIELVGGKWVDSPPEWKNGKFIWTKNVTIYSDGKSTETKPVCISGNSGQDGTGIESIVEQFYLSTSKDTQTGGKWSEDPPIWESGKYVWTRLKITYKNPTSVSYTTPTCDTSLDAMESLEEQILENKTSIEKAEVTINNISKEIGLEVSGNTVTSSISGMKSAIEDATTGIDNWLIEIYPKSTLPEKNRDVIDFSTFYGKDINPSFQYIIADADISTSLGYGDDYIGYALTFVNFIADTNATTIFNKDTVGTIYLNGVRCNDESGSTIDEKVTLKFKQGWNVLEVIWGVEKSSTTDGFCFGDTISEIDNCSLMNCYYRTITGRECFMQTQSASIKVNLDSITMKVSDVSTKIDNNTSSVQTLRDSYSQLTQDVKGFKTEVSETYATKDDVSDSLKTAKSYAEQTVDGFKQTVEATYATKDDVSDSLEESKSYAEQTVNGFKQTVEATYTTKDDFNSLEIGGRNLCRDSKKENSDTSGYMVVSYALTTGLELNKTYTIQINATTSAERKAIGAWVGGGTYTLTGMMNTPGISTTKTYTLTVTVTNSDLVSAEQTLYIYSSTVPGGTQGGAPIAGTCTVNWVKLEVGNKATDWTPAPEDVESDINSSLAEAKSYSEQTVNGFRNVVESTYVTQTTYDDDAFKTASDINTLSETTKKLSTSIDQTDKNIKTKVQELKGSIDSANNAIDGINNGFNSKVTSLITQHANDWRLDFEENGASVGSTNIDKTGITVQGASGTYYTTKITPTEFAGYYGNEKIFYLNQDWTVTKRLGIEKGLDLNNLTIVMVEQDSYKGIDFLSGTAIF